MLADVLPHGSNGFDVLVVLLAVTIPALLKLGKSYVDRRAAELNQISKVRSTATREAVAHATGTDPVEVHENAQAIEQPLLSDEQLQDVANGLPGHLQ